MPPPLYYPYMLSLTSHSFMGLPKFLPGRIHQMRAGKSSLGAYRPLWWNEPVSPECPRCSLGEETFEHAVLFCAPRSCARTQFLPSVISLRQDLPLWSSPTLVIVLSKFIKVTATGVPDEKPPLGIGSPMLGPSDPGPPLGAPLSCSRLLPPFIFPYHSLYCDLEGHCLSPTYFFHALFCCLWGPPCEFVSLR